MVVGRPDFRRVWRLVQDLTVNQGCLVTSSEDGIVVSSPYGDEQGRRITGTSDSVLIEAWQVVDGVETETPEVGCYPPGTLVRSPSRPDTWYLLPDEWRNAQRGASAKASPEVDDPILHVPSVLRQPDILTVGFPIDIVYTWVDGSDPDWKSRKARVESARLGDADAIDHTGLAEYRFASHEELLYSLRSVALYAEWANHVFIVTDRQIPQWLDVTNPRVTVVDHREIFADLAALPTFNSHAIESQLHHIPGLSEHYVYMNDDLFLGRPVAPSLFFESNGVEHMFPSDEALVDFNELRSLNFPITAAAKNVRDVFRNEFGVTIMRKMKHTPHPQRRSVLFEMEERWPTQFAATASQQFRAGDQISFASFMQPWYAYLTGRATVGEISYSYLKISSDTISERYFSLLRQRDRDAFCLNESDAHGAASAEKKELMSWFLHTYFPSKSVFERE